MVTWFAATPLVPDRSAGLVAPAGREVVALRLVVRGERSVGAAPLRLPFRETGGAGLGLALVRAIVAEHGGTLRLVNRPEGGLEASLVLPIH